MAKQQTDDELNLRRKARRRLIGAIALTLVVVAILPMVLDSEPKPTGLDIDLRIPAPDKAGEFIPKVAVSEVAKVLPLAASSVGDVLAPPAASAASAVAAPGKEPVVAGDSKPEEPGKSQPAANIQPESKTVEPKATESKAAEPKNADKPVSAESYVAQVGAFSSADAAKHELDKLKKWGFKAYTEKVGDKIRVRVGPYAEREKAEKVRQMLEKHGLHPVVISAK